MVGGAVSGKLSDRISPSFITISSLAIQALSYLSLCYLNGFTPLAINLFILGVASYAFITSNQLWVLSLCDEEQKLKAINLLSTASNLGLAVSAVIVGMFYRYGFRFIFLLTSVFLIVLTVYLIWQEKDPIKAKKHFDHQITTNHSSRKSNHFLTIYILSAVLFVGMVVSQLGTSYPIYITSNFPDFGINAISILFALNSLLVVFFETPIGNILGEFNKTRLVGIASFLIGFGMLILSFSSSFIVALLACVVYTLGEIIFFCMAQFVCYEQAEESKKGSGLGMFRMVYAGSRVAGPIAGGYIYHHLGGDCLWFFAGVIGVLYLAAGWSIANSQH